MAAGRRILFAIPWGERVILGTTDTDFKPVSNPGDALAQVCAEPADIRSILSVTNRAFPDLSLAPSDVLSSWAGLRPLIADPRGQPSDVSRGHEIQMSRPGWLEVAGGKLTTCRWMAEQTVDQAARYLGAPAVPCRTAVEPLLEPGETQFSGILPPPCTAEAVRYYCTQEWARSVEDVMLRRGGWQHSCDNPSALAAQVAEWMEK